MRGRNDRSSSAKWHGDPQIAGVIGGPAPHNRQVMRLPFGSPVISSSRCLGHARRVTASASTSQKAASTTSSASRNRTQGCVGGALRRNQLRFPGERPSQANSTTRAPKPPAISAKRPRRARQAARWAASFFTGDRHGHGETLSGLCPEAGRWRVTALSGVRAVRSDLTAMAVEAADSGLQVDAGGGVY